MFRVSIVKFGSFLSVSKQSQKLFFSSKNVISPISHQKVWTRTSEGDLIHLKAKQNVILAGMKERHELEIKYSQESLKERHQLEIKFSQEKQALLLQFLEDDENHSVQFGKEINKPESHIKSVEKGTDAVPMESPPVVAIPKLFENEDEINSFCDDIYDNQINEFTPEIAKKIVLVLTNSSGDTVRCCRVLSGIDMRKVHKSNQNAKNLSDAGFGKALSTMLCAHSDNYKCVNRINSLLWYDTMICCENMCAQDLYDAIDSPDGYDGAIFDALLKIMKHKNEREIIESGLLIAHKLIKNTKFAKSIMIEKGFLTVLEIFSDYHYCGELVTALKK